MVVVITLTRITESEQIMNDEFEKSLLHLIWTLSGNGYFITALPQVAKVKIKQGELYRLSNKHGIRPSVVIGG